MSIAPQAGLDNITTQGILEHLFYVLSGINTACIAVDRSIPSVVTSGIPAYLTEPFHPLILKIHEYYGDPELSCFLESYMSRLNERIRSASTIEGLSLELREELGVFLDIEKARNIIAKSNNPLQDLRNRQNEFKNIHVHNHFTHQQAKKKKKSVEQWMNYGEVSSETKHPFVEMKHLDSFSHSFWRDKYTVNGENNSELRAIEESGKIVALFKEMFGCEIIDAEAATREDEKRCLRPFQYGIDDILERRYQLSCILIGRIYESLNLELSALCNVLFMQDLSFFHELVHVFGSELMSPLNSLSQGSLEGLCNKIMLSITTYKSVLRVSICSSSLQEYVMRLLKRQKMPVPNIHVTVVEALTLELKHKYLGYFFPQRTFTEISMISRFLFLVNALIYRLDRSEKYNFSRILYLVFLKIKDKAIMEIGMYPGGKITDLNEMISCVELQIKELLERFSLNNEEIFSFWSNLLDIALEYVLLDFQESVDVRSYNQRVLGAVRGLSESLEKHAAECELYDFLRELEYERLLEG